MSRYFILDESPIYKDKYLIRINPTEFEKMPFEEGFRGSYGVLPARILNLSYTDYLRYARDRIGAELIGKRSKYVTPYFNYTKEAQALVKLLNARMDYIMDERKFPYEYKLNEKGEVERTPFSGENNEIN